MIARDTTPDAAAVQETAYRNAGPAGRLRIAMELSDLVRALAAAGVQFIEENGGGPGVRLRKRQRPKKQK